MKRVILILIAIFLTESTAHGVSMCILPGSGSNTSVATGTADGNRGTWIKGSHIFGEAHCSAVSMVGPDTTVEQWEKYGSYCYCRLTQVAAPNGYLANRSGGWVLLYNNGYCYASCAPNCADYAVTYRGYRRALFVSPGS